MTPGATFLRYFLFASFFLITLLNPACSTGVSKEERDAVYNLIEWNLYYANTEDLNGYMWTLHPESPVYGETESQMGMLFQAYDLNHSIEQWEILSINSQSARVRVVQSTRKVAGADPFRDNRLEAIHTLRKDSEGQWKLYTTEVNQSSLEYLDE